MLSLLYVCYMFILFCLFFVFYFLCNSCTRALFICLYVLCCFAVCIGDFVCFLLYFVLLFVCCVADVFCFCFSFFFACELCDPSSDWPCGAYWLPMASGHFPVPDFYFVLLDSFYFVLFCLFLFFYCLNICNIYLLIDCFVFVLFWFFTYLLYDTKVIPSSTVVLVTPDRLGTLLSLIIDIICIRMIHPSTVILSDPGEAWHPIHWYLFETAFVLYIRYVYYCYVLVYVYCV